MPKRGLFLRNSHRSNLLRGRGALSRRAVRGDGKYARLRAAHTFPATLRMLRGFTAELVRRRGRRLRVNREGFCRGGSDRQWVDWLPFGLWRALLRALSVTDTPPSSLQCLPLFPCPIASSPSPGRTHPISCPRKISSSQIKYCFKTGRTLRQSEANDGTPHPRTTRRALIFDYKSTSTVRKN